MIQPMYCTVQYAVCTEDYVYTLNCFLQVVVTVVRLDGTVYGGGGEGGGEFMVTGTGGHGHT